jgi:hypothetical protein
MNGIGTEHIDNKTILIQILEWFSIMPRCEL